MCLSTPKVETPAQIAPAAMPAQQTQVTNTGEEQNMAGRKERQRIAEGDTMQSMFLGQQAPATAQSDTVMTTGQNTAEVKKKYKIGE